MKKKEAKKKQQLEKELRKNASITDEATQVKKIGIILVSIILVLAIFYVIGGIITGEIKLSQKEYTVDEAQIQYDEVLLGSSLSLSDSDYYVLYGSTEDPFTADLRQLITNYSENEASLSVYYVDMDNSFNKSYLVGEGEKSNSTISAITSEADLKISTPTWIRVSNNKVTEYVEGYDAVKEAITELSETE